MDKHFVLSLNPSISDCLPHGAIVKIASYAQMQPIAVRKILAGEWSNPTVVNLAIGFIANEMIRLQEFFKQLPEDIPNQ